MPDPSYLPIYEFTRGNTIESIHQGAVAVVDSRGRLVASFGSPDAVTYLRSTAKPFQALPFITHRGHEYYQLTPREVALICASHQGTDEHVAVARSIQAKTGISEADLLCGVHPPFDTATVEALRERKEQPTPNRHNCSGKHSGMVAFVQMKRALGEAVPELEYIDFEHPIQKEILSAFAEMCGLPESEVHMGVDGCSAPNFAVPLRNAAQGYARLCDPETGGVLPEERRLACQTITRSILANPDMIDGKGGFDTRLMEVGQGRILSKGGAEGYQGIGLLPGALGPGSPAMGIMLKIADGDARKAARHAVALEVLRQLGALTSDELSELASFGPELPVYNIRRLVVGKGYPTFDLVRAE